jgi:23S rRNA (cytidine1920-2'-O)/16S rRNA (cytidine1409-2'-O)-methyltransferase
LLLERGVAATLQEAQGMILSGEVRVDDKVVTTAGSSVSEDSSIEFRRKDAFASRGGLKLAGALKEFRCSVEKLVCADVGCSTGGFTDVLLKNGAAKVYAIDVGYGDLAWNLRKDARVVVMERVNACYLDSLPDAIDLISIDVSLLSLRKVIPNVRRWLKDGGGIVALIKPQYEATSDQLPEGAVIADSKVHAAILRNFLAWCEDEKLGPKNLAASPIQGMGGNQEFLIELRPGKPGSIDAELEIARVAKSS